MKTGTLPEKINISSTKTLMEIEHHFQTRNLSSHDERKSIEFCTIEWILDSRTHPNIQGLVRSKPEQTGTIRNKTGTVSGTPERPERNWNCTWNKLEQTGTVPVTLERREPWKSFKSYRHPIS
jgi:hypothetical protein